MDHNETQRLSAGLQIVRAIAVAGLAIVFAAVGSVACGAADDDTSTSNGDNDEVGEGLGSQDASADVRIVSFSGPDALGFYTGTAEVTNNSSGTSDYYIEANVEDSAGTVQGYTNATVSNLAAGAKATVDFVPTEGAAGWTLVVTEVQRTSSG